MNLRTLANASGYTGTTAATVTFLVGSGVVITGAAGVPNGGAAIDTGAWPTGSYSIALALSVQNNGKVRGGGGGGGDVGAWMSSGSPGGAGGDAVFCQVPISITVDSGGEIGAGGGRGGGGGGDVEYIGEEPSFYGGGGGGGGVPNGPGGLAVQGGLPGPQELLALRAPSALVAGRDPGSAGAAGTMTVLRGGRQYRRA